MFHLTASSGCKIKLRQICVPVLGAPLCLLAFPLRVGKMVVGCKGREDTVGVKPYH